MIIHDFFLDFFPLRVSLECHNCGSGLCRTARWKGGWGGGAPQTCPYFRAYAVWRVSSGPRDGKLASRMEY